MTELAELGGSRQESGRIEYAVESGLRVEEFIDVLRRSSLAERRPVADRERMSQMVARADLVVTARHDGVLVGVARALTDFCYCTYLSDLAVDRAFQRQGIGRELLRRTHAAAGWQTMLVLLAAPQARSYYPHVGLRPHDSCWIGDRLESPTAGLQSGEERNRPIETSPPD